MRCCSMLQTLGGKQCFFKCELPSQSLCQMILMSSRCNCLMESMAEAWQHTASGCHWDQAAVPQQRLGAGPPAPEGLQPHRQTASGTVPTASETISCSVCVLVAMECAGHSWRRHVAAAGSEQEQHATQNNLAP